MKDMMPFDNITKIVIAIIAVVGLAVIVTPQTDPLAKSASADAPQTGEPAAAAPVVPTEESVVEAEPKYDENGELVEAEDGKARPRSESESVEDFSDFGQPTLDASPLGGSNENGGAQSSSDVGAQSAEVGTAYSAASTTPQIGQVISEGSAPTE